MLKFTLLTLTLGAGIAFAGQASVPIGFGFANACAGNGAFSGLPNPGDGFGNLNNSQTTCNLSMAAIATASASGSGVSVFGSVPFSNSASAYAEAGVIKVGATNSGAGVNGFPGGAAYGGWNDSLTITGGSGDGIWVAPLFVDGALTATGNGALTRMGVAVYKNLNFLQPYATTLNANAYAAFLAANGGASGVRNDVILFSWDYQGAWFGANEFAGPGDVPSFSISKNIYFAIPFTYGTPFTLGVYMGGVAGETSSSGDTTVNSSVFDFTHTASWGGPGVVLDPGGNNPSSSFNVNSNSGFNYNVPFAPPPSEVPEPGTAGLAAAAVGAFAIWKRWRTA
jgi:hypothetical protein